MKDCLKEQKDVENEIQITEILFTEKAIDEYQNEFVTY